MIARTALPLASVAFVGVAACGRGAAPSVSERATESPTTEAAKPEQTKLATSARGSAGSAGVRSAPGTAAWRIESGRVGSIAIGERLPDALLGQDLASRYLARYIADAQPVDGFVYEAPAMLVILSSGPFRAQFANTGNSAKLATDTLRSKAAAAARDGAKVQMVMVRGAGPTTAAGVGVGSTLAALEAAYTDLTLTATPETLGDDVCQASSNSLPGVHFMFASCSQAKTGVPVIRIDVWNQTE